MSKQKYSPAYTKYEFIAIEHNGEAAAMCSLHENPFVVQL